MQFRSGIVIGGPRDGDIGTLAADVTGSDIITDPGWDGHYRRVSMSEKAVALMWFSNPPDRWTKRRTKVDFQRTTAVPWP